MGKGGSMPALPSAAEQARVLATLMGEQRVAQEAMYNQRQDEVRAQEEERLKSEKAERLRMTKLQSQQEATIAEAERQAQLAAADTVVEDATDEEQLIYGFHGLYGDWEDEDVDSTDEEVLPE